MHLVGWSSSRRLAACTFLAAALMAGSLSGCDKGAADRATSPAFAELAQAAQLAGVAEDHHGGRIGGGTDRSSPVSKRFTQALLRAAGVELPDGVRVVSYRRYTGVSGVGRCSDVPASCTWYTGVANRMDTWQLCVADSHGRWLTYGDAVGVQATGESTGRPACTYSGEHDPDLDGVFDPRAFARSFEAHLTRHGHLIPSDDPIPLDAKILARFGQTLKAGWRIPVFHQAGYTELQYCLYGPDGRWFYVHDARINDYGASGRCRLDPRYLHASE